MLVHGMNKLSVMVEIICKSKSIKTVLQHDLCSKAFHEEKNSIKLAFYLERKMKSGDSNR